MPDQNLSQILSARVALAPPLEDFPLCFQLMLTGQSSDAELRTTKSLNITGCLMLGGITQRE